MLSVDHLSATTVVDAVPDEVAVRQRLNSFKLGKAMSLSLSSDAPGSANPSHRHRRSHSRNVSVSSTSSQTPAFPPSRLSEHHHLSSFSFGSLSASSSSPALGGSESTPGPLANSSPAPPAPKRSSHHRRRSSVSTRHESAELMGVSLPDLPALSMEHNVNLGEKDSIRRRALWALEGKPDVSFSKVEIPELGTPDMEKLMFDFSTKPALPAAPSSGFGNAMMGGKRDSFKLLPPSGSSKDQLHTLLEEEEEEEEEGEEECDTQNDKDPQDSLPSPTTSNEEADFLPPVISKVPSSRPRPATLHLRPLSLTPDTVGSIGLPTPSLTPSPRSGLRSLSLNPAQTVDESTSSDPRRDGASRRPVLNLKTESTAETSSTDLERKAPRRSSISYRRSSSHSSFGLPTPETTPTFGRRCSVTESIRSSKSVDEEFFPAHPTYRPLSASEQHFLFKSHNALLARITDLEKALSLRRVSVSGYSLCGSSRPNSVLSDASVPGDSDSPASSTPGEPSDEMLSLIRDLKAERDELKKDVDGWRTRVADLDKQLVLVAKRVENERKEAWVARSRLGILEAEKAALDKRLVEVDRNLASMEAEKAFIVEENALLKKETEEKDRRIRELEEDLKIIKQELGRERSKAEFPRSPHVLESTATPTPQTLDRRRVPDQGLGLDTPFDDMQSFSFGFTSNVVAMADQDDLDEEDGLVGYEDEDERDVEFGGSFSFDSLTDYGRGSPEILAADVSTNRITSSEDVTPRLTHISRHSLSRTWTFPKSTPTSLHDDQSDKFFGCLDESDASDDPEPLTPMPLSYENSKDLFANALKFADQDDAPFYIPGGIGVVVEPSVFEMKTERTLDAVAEEDEGELGLSAGAEGDDDVFGEVGGIRIIFTPPDEVEEVKEQQLNYSPGVHCIC
ncbi:hypothetical protein NMY22_g14777 [Coprinellus aureogranulatus]|nr:hypothetical protein NMY22_g14777 [Coprinellus aureogranulatus]